MPNEWELCELSIAMVVNRRRQSAAEPKTPSWMHEFLCRIARQIPTRYPYEVLCLDRMRVADAAFRSDYRNVITIECVWMLQRGWDVGMSLQVWRNFRFAFPQLKFDPIAFKVMHRKDLVEEYGETFGNIFADLCIDPDSQPVIGALLYNQFNQNIPRPCTMAVTSCEIAEELIEDFLRVSNMTVDINLQFVDFAGFGVTDSATTMPTQNARGVYNKCTGGNLRDTFTLHPRDLDYGNPEKAPR